MKGDADKKACTFKKALSVHDPLSKLPGHLAKNNGEVL